MKENLPSSPEVSLNPHSDLPAAGVISTEISPVPAGEPSDPGEPSGVSPRVSNPPLPFGVYFGATAAPSENSETLKP